MNDRARDEARAELGRNALWRPGACDGPDLALASRVRRHGFLHRRHQFGTFGRRHSPAALSPTSGLGAVLGRNALSKPGDCGQARPTTNDIEVGDCQEGISPEHIDTSEIPFVCMSMFLPSCCGGRKAEVKKSGPVPLNLRPPTGFLRLKTCGETQAPRQTANNRPSAAQHSFFTRRLRMGRAKAAISHHFSLSVARQVAKLVDQSRVETRMKEDWLCEVLLFWRRQSS